MFTTNTFVLSIPIEYVALSDSPRQHEMTVAYDVFNGTNTWCNPTVNMELHTILMIKDSVGVTAFVMDAIRSHANKQICSQG